MDKAHIVALALSAFDWPSVAAAQTDLTQLNGARFVEEYRNGGQVLARFTFEIRGTQGRWSEWSVGQPTHRMTCTMQGRTCDLCCGQPGTLGSRPGSTHRVEVLADGRNAIWRFRASNGVSQDITLVRSR
jgi:hypothetical protein